VSPENQIHRPWGLGGGGSLRVWKRLNQEAALVRLIAMVTAEVGISYSNTAV